jgi:phosphatidate phosphatase APP1
MAKRVNYKKLFIKVYHGYGHTHDLIIFGHVFKGKPLTRKRFSNNYLTNILYLLRLFFVRPVAGVKVQLEWRGQFFYSTTEKDGFFKFEWKSDDEVLAGWHDVKVSCTDSKGEVKGEGKLFVPNSTQFAFISDIDDTVLISHSATIGKRLRVLFTKNPRGRKPFLDVAKHYELLASAHTTAQVPNPFFFVSSSEWNLYDDLVEFFNYNKLPKGTFLLNQVKRWFQLWKTGKTKHEGKMLRIMRILNTFPKQQFILLGDNTQSDPAIYTSLANKLPGKIFAIYINNVSLKKEMATKQVLDSVKEVGTFVCLHKDNAGAMAHSKAIGLI